MTTLRPSLRSQSSQVPAKIGVGIKSYNVMELLVTEEVNKQIQLLTVKTSKIVQSADVIAYALNRLPSLYATSKIGWQRQLNRAKTEFSKQINNAVQQGIIAVQKDPLHISDLINDSSENGEVNQAANAALERLKVVLRREDLSWENLASVVENHVNKSNYSRLRHSTDSWETYRY
ncbi:late competence development ComFB family protein [Dolichospermum sp. UHCC 0259]|uniref:late competence development ComFB family protein n=1 Tax=Dolichospermum sp. UHCC 0259 TaxID=2590010 RepID=UPI001445E7F3|nr:late competence development ComFB family protein [Dolichospermum sp. UHCC 0259]MTJ46929.1 competence protein ComFB [Dolichospermum sp. UHCC 0259]